MMKAIKKSWILFSILASFQNIGAQTSSENPILSEWQLANPFGISVGQPSERRWEAGRVNDILEIDPNTILTASDAAGVWMLRRGGSVAVSQSKSWVAPDMNSLAKYSIPASNRIAYFAGGSNQPGNAGALYQTNFASRAPLLESWQSIPVNNVGVINKILVLQAINKIVLATSNGIWSSAIPLSGLPADYRFVQARAFDNYARSFYDLTETAGNTVVATIKGSNRSRLSKGIFFGLFTGDNLAFAPSTVTGLSAAELNILGTISVSSGISSRNTVYAIAAQDTSGETLALVKSIDGGRNFTRLPLVITNNPSPQFGISGMDRTNCIDVHPADPNIVVFGWVTGPYISYNGGISFYEVTRYLTHDDKACLAFSRFNNNTLYMGSDGGVTSFHSLTSRNNYELDHTWNMRLPTLQFVGPTAIRQWWGRLDANVLPTLQIGGGLQDNDVVLSEGNQPWKHLERGFDGGTVFFPACGGILWAGAGMAFRYRRSFDQTDSEIPIRVFAPGADRRNNVLTGLISKVNTSGTRKRNAAGQNMFFISASNVDIINGTADNNTLYGIFANADGTDMHAEYLATINATQGLFTSALSGNDPYELFAGKRTSGMLYKLIWNSTTRTYDQPTTSGITPRNNFNAAIGGIIDITNSSEAFAFGNDESLRGSIYFTRNGSEWNMIPSPASNETIYSMDIFKNSCKEILFVATDKAIYATTNRGRDWINVSYGLPAVPHISDIHVIPSSNCTSEIFISTYGWSVWRARIK